MKNWLKALKQTTIDDKERHQLSLGDANIIRLYPTFYEVFHRFTFSLIYPCPPLSPLSTFAIRHYLVTILSINYTIVCKQKILAEEVNTTLM